MIKINPVLDLPLNEGSGTTVYDRSGHNNHVTLFGATWQKIWRDWVLYFDGADDYGAIQNLYFNKANQLKEFTVIAWVKIPLTGGDWSILDFDRSEYFTCCAGVPSGSASGEGDYVGFHTTASGYGIHDMWSVSPVRDNEWHCIAWRFNCYEVYDKKIYIDGVLDAQADAYPTGVGVGSGVTRYGFIGDGSEASSFNGNRNNIYYEGYIGEIKFFLKALDDDQIAFLATLFKGEKRSPP